MDDYQFSDTNNQLLYLLTKAWTVSKPSEIFVTTDQNHMDLLVKATKNRIAALDSYLEEPISMPLESYTKHLRERCILKRLLHKHAKAAEVSCQNQIFYQLELDREEYQIYYQLFH